MLTNAMSIKEQNVHYSSDTVVLGEKLSDAGDYFMDLYENVPQTGGNDMSIAEQCRHDNRHASSAQTRSPRIDACSSPENGDTPREMVSRNDS